MNYVQVKVIGRIDVGKAYSINKFIIDCSEMTELIGGLKVHMAGPPRSAAHLNIIDNNDGTYKVEYKVCCHSINLINYSLLNSIANIPWNVQS